MKHYKKGYFMNQKKIGMAVFTTPLVFSCSLNANELNNLHGAVKHDVSKEVVKIIDNKTKKIQ